MANHSKKKSQRKNNKKKKTSPSSLTTSVDDSSNSGSSYYYDDTNNGDNDTADATITGNNKSHNQKHTRNVNDNDNISWTTDPSLLRFQVGGTKVECNTSNKGLVIIGNYNNSNSHGNNEYYNNDKRFIYAPMDCHYVIRKSTLLPQWQRGQVNCIQLQRAAGG
ncbi:hypothetical protein FRACYDRAFT_243803 [Fragilariopsis cylindrus CCMP1102]|uniref:Uncharacterized protein n=1 Tax=Fragilariopsis cylindrus CCMP1102 TaxID=635003 RepID=A0A1E7F302_9STRA|nr:hypothetical protein FRACYDRAFT_243803 [Fragilariopsis cylindrus CCMP1102]|eukprot:OEU12551.1 hypothetical protein FRACYDRAFT_243803 [Fragilariopsis cylindrus CCMP1102]